MLFNIILWILAIIAPALTLWLTGGYVYWYFDLIGLIAIPICYLLLFALYLLILFFISLCIKTKKTYCNPNKVAYFITYQTNYILCKIVAKIKINGLEKIPQNQRFLLVYNHRSNWDPMVLMATINKSKVFYVTKPGNMHLPICGPFIHRAGFIQINRENNKEGLLSISRAIKYIENDVGSIALAPEGTRNKKLETDLLDFHAGSFKVATKTESPIVVAVIKNAEKIHKNFPFKKTHVTIDILDVITFNQYKDKDTQQISNEVYNMMLEDIQSNSSGKKGE